MRIAVLSDIHAALGPFQNALADACREGFDQLVLLGDLFTYGVQPLACADLAADAIDKHGAIFIGGNHDQFYVDLASGDVSLSASLPDWIRESAVWTWQELGQTWPGGLTWLDEWSTGSLLMAHANPFGFGDWTYLSDSQSLLAAAARIEQRGYRSGVFGHAHRRAQYRTSSGIEVNVVGSLGQPRARDEPVPQWSMITIDAFGQAVAKRYVDFDPASHRASIRATPGLSEQTKHMLCRYFA